MDAMEEERVASPCIRVCRMNEEHGFCEGCFRSLEEIYAWREADNGRRQDILEQSRARRQQWDPEGAALRDEA